jgi:predicted DsbA family dithiol-disulfide isomerase
VPRRPTSHPIPLVLHGDLLDPFSWIAERRIVIAADDLPGRYKPLSHAALPRRWDPLAPTAAERRAHHRELRLAAREPDAPRFAQAPEAPWGETGPLPSAPALLAVAAAKLQGANLAGLLRESLRQAALCFGLDVSRRDVIVEVAARTGLDLAHFVLAFEAPATERALLDDVQAAYDLGVDVGPALVIDDVWLVTGLRSLADYRTLLERYLARLAGQAAEHTVH